MAGSTPQHAPRPQDARAALVRCLQGAHAGELGAVRAYLGHRRSLPRGEDREGIARILKDEVHHRRRLRAMLRGLGAAPSPQAERRMDRIGRAIALSCLVSGWFIPMYGAARLESANVIEYEIAARYAWLAGERPLVDELLAFGAVEWDHESWLRRRAEGHRLWRFFPRWPEAAPRHTIRGRFEAWLLDPRPPRRRRTLLDR